MHDVRSPCMTSAETTRNACAKRNSCCCRRYQVLLNDEHLQDSARANAIFAPADDDKVIQVSHRPPGYNHSPDPNPSNHPEPKPDPTLTYHPVQLALPARRHRRVPRRAGRVVHVHRDGVHVPGACLGRGAARAVPGARREWSRRRLAPTLTRAPTPSLTPTRA